MRPGYRCGLAWRSGKGGGLVHAEDHQAAGLDVIFAAHRRRPRPGGRPASRRGEARFRRLRKIRAGNDEGSRRGGSLRAFNGRVGLALVGWRSNMRICSPFARGQCMQGPSLSVLVFAVVLIGGKGGDHFLPFAQGHRAPGSRRLPGPGAWIDWLAPSPLPGRGALAAPPRRGRAPRGSPPE